MKNHIIIILMALNFSVSAQQPPVKWKEIPMEDLKMTSYEAEPGAPAVVLCDYEKIYFDINPNGRNLFLFYDRHVRIKILKPEGIKYAKFSIPYIYMPCQWLSSENSIIIKAMVYNLSEKGQLIARKIKPKEIKYRDSTNCYKIAELNFPDVKQGTIIEFYYKRPSFDMIQPQTWYFQQRIPVRHSELRMCAPRAFRYVFSPVNTNEFDSFEETYYQGHTLQYFQDISGTQMRFVKKNMPSFNTEKFIGKPEDYMQKLNMHLQFAKQENMDPRWRMLVYQLYLTTYEDYDEYAPGERTILDFPSGYIVYQLKDWEGFSKKMLKSQEFGLPLTTYWEYKEPLQKILGDKTDPRERMITIYDYLRKNIKWNQKYTTEVKDAHSQFINKMYTKITHKMIKEKSLSKPFENKEGSSCEVNFILVYLLNKAGIESYPVLIGTRKNGMPDKNIPSQLQFNHVIANAIIEGQSFLLDATDPFRPYHYLDIEDLNPEGFVVKAENPEWVPIINGKISTLRTTEKISVDSNLNFKNEIKYSVTGYDAIELRKKLYSSDKERIKKDFEMKCQNQQPFSGFDVLNAENDTLPLQINFTKTILSNSDTAIKIIPYFDPVYNESDFDESFRQLPIDLVYPFLKTYVMEINAPDGFKVITPNNETFSTYANYAGFSFTTNNSGNKVIIQIELKILASAYPAAEYNNLRELFTRLNDKLNEAIIVKPAK
ncbi:MAG: DUF3857 domain-containing protein [Bacteroidales bacterium]